VNELDDQIKKENLLLILVGNKCDIEPGKKEVDTLTAQKYATENNMMLFEVSAKTGEKVDELFKRMAEDIAKLMDNPTIKK